MVTFDLSNILSILSSFSSSALLVWAAVSRLIGVRQSASCSCHSLGHSNLLAPLSHCIEPPLVNDSMNLDRDSKSPQQHCPQTGGSSVSSKIGIFRFLYKLDCYLNLPQILTIVTMLS